MKPKEYMKLTMNLAKKGHPSPNPFVGCIIVKDSNIIGKGYHKKAGKNHAEVEAILTAEKNGYSVNNATMFVTLEPCVHHGKTPPCTDLIIKKKISKVYIAMLDPNPLVVGKGKAKLEKNGVEVDVGCLKKEARKLNEIFITYITEKRPFVLMKSALSLDGKITYGNGKRKQITRGDSLHYAHCLRNKYDAILVGINTIIKDEPLLNCRIKPGKDPIKIILDPLLKIPLESNVIRNNPDKTIICISRNSQPKKQKLLERKGAEIINFDHNPIQIEILLKELYRLEISSIIVEGGSKTYESFLNENLVDKINFFFAPKLIGEDNSVIKTNYFGRNVRNLHIKKLDYDFLVTGYLN